MPTQHSKRARTRESHGRDAVRFEVKDWSHDWSPEVERTWVRAHHPTRDWQAFHNPQQRNRINGCGLPTFQVAIFSASAGRLHAPGADAVGEPLERRFEAGGAFALADHELGAPPQVVRARRAVAYERSQPADDVLTLEHIRDAEIEGGALLGLDHQARPTLALSSRGNSFGSRPELDLHRTRGRIDEWAWMVELWGR
jgi:hypothetical protein